MVEQPGTATEATRPSWRASARHDIGRAFSRAARRTGGRQHGAQRCPRYPHSSAATRNGPQQAHRGRLTAFGIGVATKNSIQADGDAAMGYSRAEMIDLLKLLGGLLVGLCRSRAAREAEMAFLRQQLLVLKRAAPARPRLRTADRPIFVWLYRLFPSLLGAAVGHLQA
jgi:hypothetical protein